MFVFLIQQQGRLTGFTHLRLRGGATFDEVKVVFGKLIALKSTKPGSPAPGRINGADISCPLIPQLAHLQGHITCFRY